MSNTNSLIISKFYLDVTFIKNGAANKGWIWLLIEEVVPEK